MPWLAAQTMNSIEYLGSHAEALFLGAGRLEYPLLGDCCNVCVVHNPENGMEKARFATVRIAN